jgi:hypothetical protein
MTAEARVRLFLWTTVTNEPWRKTCPSASLSTRSPTWARARTSASAARGLWPWHGLHVSSHSYEWLRSWREFMKRNFAMRVAVSHKRNVIFEGYISERPKNIKKLEIDSFIYFLSRDWWSTSPKIIEKYFFCQPWPMEYKPQNYWKAAV